MVASRGLGDVYEKQRMFRICTVPYVPYMYGSVVCSVYVQFRMFRICTVPYYVQYMYGSVCSVHVQFRMFRICILLYTFDAADDLQRVRLGEPCVLNKIYIIRTPPL